MTPHPDPELVARLRTTLTTEAVLAMGQTDTTGELQRLQQRVGTRRQRVPVRIAVASSFAAIIVVVLVIVAFSAGRGHPTRVTPLAGPNPTQAASVLPAGFPTSLTRTLAKPVADQPTGQATLGFAPTGRVTLANTRGASNETATFPAPGEITFSPDSFLCSTPGTYRYQVQGRSMTFTTVSDASCPDRRTFLVAGSWLVAATP